MRIAFLTDGIYPYVLGGMQRHSYYVCKYLARNKIRIRLFHFNQGSYDINALECFTEEEKAYIDPVVLDFPPSGRLPGHYIRESYRYSVSIYEALKPEINQFDFIYAKGFSGWKLLEERKRGLSTPPVGVKFHGMNMFQRKASFRSWLESYLFRGPVKFNMNNADFVFSYGGKITDIIKETGVSSSKIIEVGTGVTDDWLDDTINVNSGINFLFVGRYERLKGIQELGEAISVLKQKGLDFSFYFVGPIPEHLRLRHDGIHYTGAITDQAQLKAIYKKCDVLVCPSYSEGMPNVILEAMAQSLTVLATDTGATSILVNDNTGWLINTCNTALIVSALEEIINLSPMELKRKKQSAFEHVRDNFRWEKISEVLVDKISGCVS